MVHFVNASDLQNESKTTAFKLLFTQQMGRYPETELNPDLERAGEYWIEHNLDKILIVIDGLDQFSSSLNGRYSKINSSTTALASTIVSM